MRDPHRLPRNALLFGMTIAAMLAAPAPASAQATSTAPSATERLNQAGPEQRALAERTGLWDVTETVWATPNAAPVVTTGLVAERVMIGPVLQEFIRQPADVAHKAVVRTDLLSFNRLEGNWGYVSVDTRVPVGLMHAWSTGHSDTKTIEVTFAPFAIPREGVDAVGQLVRMDQVVRYVDADHDAKDQYFTLADGTGTRWMVHRYGYVRRKSP